ncbi:MAG: hypothetical protein J1D86_07540 [Alistipes sp.]|nr:hypothetical protein [Alistipes sp.]
MKKVLFVSLFAALLAAGCSKEEPTKDVEIVFTQSKLSQVKKDAIQEILNSKGANNIRNIYLIPEEGTWSNVGFVQALRNNVLQPSIELSPKVRGKGDFNFEVGEASKVPEDSLWFVQHGWTINKRFLENK